MQTLLFFSFWCRPTKGRFQLEARQRTACLNGILKYPFFLLFLVQNYAMNKLFKLNLSTAEADREYFLCYMHTWIAEITAGSRAGVQEAAHGQRWLKNWHTPSEGNGQILLHCSSPGTYKSVQSSRSIQTTFSWKFHCLFCTGQYIWHLKFPGTALYFF